MVLWDSQACSPLETPQSISKTKHVLNSSRARISLHMRCQWRNHLPDISGTWTCLVVCATTWICNIREQPWNCSLQMKLNKPQSTKSMTTASFPRLLTNLAKTSKDMAAEYHSLLGQSLLLKEVLCFCLSRLCHSSFYSPLLLSPWTHTYLNTDLSVEIAHAYGKRCPALFLLPSLLLTSKGYLEGIVLVLVTFALHCSVA